MGGNTLGRLNDELFAQLERLREVDASDPEALAAEVSRSKAVEGISRMVVDNAKTVLAATQMRADLTRETAMPRMLEG